MIEPHPHHRHHIHLPRIGMRIVKTALAIFVALLIANLLMHDILGWAYFDGSFAVISAVLTIQGSIRSSVRSALERIGGTLLGVLIGLVFLSLDLALGRVQIVFYLFASIGTVLVIYICKAAKYVSISSLCVVVFLSILFARSSQHPYEMAMVRIVETAVGVVVALLINILIYPPKVRHHCQCGAEFAQQCTCPKTPPQGEPLVP